eukprot:TRINITY_DN8141_c0_g1_i1.p1 TRINITY_DN8141_c0_g1~~TRINITY_DN8141_c0_g1_i1.p1  ORF type:complete len:522 (+),score=58.62 TRINITY_DN8141_c0_g1_i1:107-1672(+)
MSSSALFDLPHSVSDPLSALEGPFKRRIPQVKQQKRRSKKVLFEDESDQYGKCVRWVEELGFQPIVPQGVQKRLLGCCEDELLRVCRTAEVVVVLCSAKVPTASVDCVKMTVNQCRKHQSLIAMVLEDYGPNATSTDCDLQIRLLYAGADHVVFQRGDNAAEIHLDLLMAAQDVDLDRQLALERCNNLFWSEANQTIDEILPGMSEVVVLGEGESPDYVRLGEDLCEINAFLGAGSFAEVRSIVSKTTRKAFAMKLYSKAQLRGRNDLHAIMREFQWVGKIPAHPNVVKLIQSLQDPEWFFLIMDDAGPSLFRYQQSLESTLDPDNGQVFIWQILRGIAHCHLHEVSHRDLKPENIGIRARHNGEIRPLNHLLAILDFGSAASTKKRSTDKVGTPAFMAPEILDGEKYYGAAADTWAMGVILFELLFGLYSVSKLQDKAPGTTRGAKLSSVFTDHKDLRRKVEKSTSQRPLEDDPWELLTALLCVNPKLRVTAPSALEYRWLSGLEAQAPRVPNFTERITR